MRELVIDFIERATSRKFLIALLGVGLLWLDATTLHLLDTDQKGQIVVLIIAYIAAEGARDVMQVKQPVVIQGDIVTAKVEENAKPQ